MATINIKTSVEMFNFANIFITQTKEEILTKLSKYAVQKIQQESNGQHKSKLNYKSGGFTIGELKTIDDPTGNKAKEIERRTLAYKKTYNSLTDEAIVAEILNL